LKYQQEARGIDGEGDRESGVARILDGERLRIFGSVEKERMRRKKEKTKRKRDPLQTSR
jgi:hypothetical protein